MTLELDEADKGSQDFMDKLECPFKAFELYSVVNGEALKAFKKGVIIWLIF